MAEPPSRMQITGRNALIAAGLALAAAVLLAVLAGIAGIMMNGLNGDEVSLSAFTHQAVGGLMMGGLCGSPIVFIMAFALLQRLRIKN